MSPLHYKVHSEFDQSISARLPQSGQYSLAPGQMHIATARVFPVPGQIYTVTGRMYTELNWWHSG